MTLTYGKLMEYLEQYDIDDINKYASNISEFLIVLLKKGEYKKVSTLLTSIINNNVLQGKLPYYQLLDIANDTPPHLTNELYLKLIEIGYASNDKRVDEMIINRINACLFKHESLDDAKIYLDILEKRGAINADYYTYYIYWYTKCTSKELFYTRVTKMHLPDLVYKLLDCYKTNNDKFEGIEFIIDACFKAIENHKYVIDHLNSVDLIINIFKYFPDTFDRKFEMICDFAVQLQNNRIYGEAIKIYQLLIRNKYNVSSCYWNILLSKCKCTNNHELIKRGKNFESLPEYRSTLEECLNEGIDETMYTQVVKDTKKYHKKIRNNLITMIVLLSFLLTALGLGLYFLLH